MTNNSSMQRTSTSEPKLRPRVLIIPAAGAGIRFRELGKNYPKCTLPVQGTPIIVTAIKMLAENTGEFDLVVIAVGSETQREQVVDALRPHTFSYCSITDIAICVVDTPASIVPSPAYSLGVAMDFAQEHLNVFDVDATVFLSDMLPTTQEVAKSVVYMRQNAWGVVRKPLGDFARWCMVAPDGEGSSVFYDKPTTQPPTKLAAVGVYRWGSSYTYLNALDVCMASVSRTASEIQFSDVAVEYQKEYPICIEVFVDKQFKDFGTLEEYLYNKGVNKCRSFNNILDSGDYVIKSSLQYDKMRDEAVWLQNVPAPIKKYVPRVDEVDLMGGSFRMEKVRSSNLRDVALYFDRSYDAWAEIFRSVARYQTMTEITAKSQIDGHNNDSFWNKVQTKTEDRYLDVEVSPLQKAFADEWLATDFNECIKSLMYERDDYDFGNGHDPVVYYHGDLHFANMFYCFYYKDLKLIDPRGEVRGSALYDLAKLAHSVIGRYDYIDAEMYRLDEAGNPFYYDKGHENIEKAFYDVIFSILPAPTQKKVLTITASLFLSMIPLHSDKPEHCKLFFKEFERMVAAADAA